MRRKQLNILFLFVSIFFVLLYAVFSWFQIITTTAPDFSVYYGAATRLLSFQPLTGDTGLYTGFGYPPTTLLLFFPFTIFPYTIAQGLWVTLSFLLIPIIVWLTMKIFTLPHTQERIALWSSLFFLSFPTRFTLGMGQINLLSLLFLLWGIWLVTRKQDAWASLLFTLMLVSKPQLIFLLAFLFVVGKWKVASGAFMLYCLFSLCIALVFGFDYFLSYVTLEVPQLTEFIGRDIYYNQAYSAFFSRAFPLPTAKAITQVLTLVTLLGTKIFIRKRRVAIPLFILLFLPVFLLVEPLGWQHHFVFILPVYMVFWSMSHTVIEKGILIFSFLLVSLNIPNPSGFTGMVSTTFVLSHAFWGNVVLLSFGLYLLRDSKHKIIVKKEHTY